MKKPLFITNLFFVVVALTTFSSCYTVNKTMREPFARVELEKDDFTLSDQVTAEAYSRTIFGIDFKRLRKRNTGEIQSSSFNINLANIPVVGNVITNKTANFALYELMNSNPGYDVVFYPQYETSVKRPVWIGFFCRKTTVKVTARLAKLNK
jgi:hypothetical protein